MNNLQEANVPKNASIIMEYKGIFQRLFPLLFSRLSEAELDEALNYSIDKRLNNNPAYIDNNYKKQVTNTTIFELTNYIMDKKPIITSYGVMFSRHGTVPNPLYTMTDGFINDRKKEKKKMFKYPKGSLDFEQHNLMQLLLKIDANGLYGIVGNATSLFFNLYVAAGITTQGRSCISAAALLFESFFNNNVPFGSFEEIVTFVDNVRQEKRTYNDKDILDEDISLEETFFQIITNVGFGYIPTEEEADMLWMMLSKMSNEDLNRLFYKNNLFNFMDNSTMQNAIVYILCKLEMPYLNPNSVPAEIKVELEEFWFMIKEYVYYDKQIIDRIDKLDSLIRSVIAIIDTDSTILSLDGWYRYVLNIIKDVPMRIKTELINPITIIEADEFGERDLIKPFEIVENLTEYDFLSDEIIEKDRLINPYKIVPQDGLKFSIINIMAYCTSQMIVDFMYKYSINSNSQADDRNCLLVMKNEFYFGKLLLTDGMKNYASTQLLQEGNKIPIDKSLDIKGLPAFTKSTMNITTRTKLKEILYETIMKPNEIDQIAVLKEIAKIEKEMFNSIQKGEKEYYKPARIKSQNSYENPLRIQGIKASLVYNSIKDPNMQPIDLESRNSIIIIKCDITPKNAIRIIDTYPDTYARIMSILQTKEFNGEITAMALPLNEEVPKWILPFVDYSTIISDNVSLFPLSSIGLYRGNSVNNHSNIIKM